MILTEAICSGHSSSETAIIRRFCHHSEYYNAKASGEIKLSYMSVQSSRLL
jgi:hypothetical protein